MSNNTSVLSINNYHESIASQTPSWFHVTLGVVVLVTNLVTIISNGSVTYALLVKDRKLLTRLTVYIIAICCLNLLTSTFGTPMVVASCFNKVWMFGEFGCTTYAFLMTFGGLASMLLLTMISIDRYIYVVKRNLSRQQPTKPIIITLSICLLMTFGFSISPLLGWNKYTYSGVGTSCAIDLATNNNNGQSFVITICVIYFILPVSLMIFAYGSIYVKTNNNNGQSFVITICVIYFILPVSLMIFAYGSIYVKVSKESKANLGYSRRRTFVVSRQEFQLKLTIEQELAVTITSIIGFFLICYTPFTFVLLLRVLIKDVEIDPIVMAIPSMITKIAGIFTPFVFLRKNKVFREHMMKIYPCLRSRKKVHAAESIEQTAVTNVHNNDKTTIVNRPEANEGNNFKQCDNRKCSPIKKKTTTNEGNNSEGCDNRKCSLIRQETTTNDITERTKKVQDNCSNIAVYTVDKSDIYEYQKESSFSRNVGKCSVGIIDTLDAENVMNLSGV